MPVSFRRALLCATLFAAFAGPAFAASVDAQIQIILGTEKLPADNLVSLQAFYASRAFAPVWTGADMPVALAVLVHADEEGLDPNDYPVPNTLSPAGRDVAITNALLTYMHDVRLGRPGLERIDADVELPSQSLDASATLTAALNSRSLAATLAALAPAQPEYASLKAGLAFYQGIAEHGGWSPLPSGSPTDFAPGSPGEAPLRHRLLYEDHALADPSANLIEAVKRFQARHGLVADGQIGARTLAELNVPASTRVVEIISNMERWRWLPRAFEPSIIQINVPDARLTLTLDGKQVLDSVVVVGRPHDPTPILRAEGAGVTVNPPWNVPASIARREILPKLKANPSYLLSQDMTLVDGPPDDPHGLHVNWRAVSNGTFPWRIQQHPGPKNSLGLIKIELPNRFDVYLHDTPGKSAFALPVRDVSHGCVRVQQILPLASYALAADLSAVNEINDVVAVGTTKYLPLQRHLPVYFLYWTAFPGPDGTLQFRPDIYGRDQRLIASLRVSTPQRISANLVKCTRG
jgi:murein L,D-transpeptidase YcbB/YkuD